MNNGAWPPIRHRPAVRSSFAHRMCNPVVTWQQRPLVGGVQSRGAPCFSTLPLRCRHASLGLSGSVWINLPNRFCFAGAGRREMRARAHAPRRGTEMSARGGRRRPAPHAHWPFSPDAGLPVGRFVSTTGVSGAPIERGPSLSITTASSPFDRGAALLYAWRTAWRKAWPEVCAGLETIQAAPNMRVSIMELALASRPCPGASTIAMDTSCPMANCHPVTTSAPSPVGALGELPNPFHVGLHIAPRNGDCVAGNPGARRDAIAASAR